jgi:predicted MPP superfamily phosphohydrolase
VIAGRSSESGAFGPGIRTALIAAGATAVSGAGVFAWSTLAEPRMFALRRIDLPVLPAGSWPIRVLHLSDLHIVPGQKRKTAWVSSLADLRPDLVINTGDTLSHRKAVPAAVAAFGNLLDVPGAFVFGNNDFYAPVRKSPHRYFLPSSPATPKGPELPWQDLRAAQAERGWLDLSNVKSAITIRGQRIALAGVNDPYTRRDRYEKIAGPADPAALIRIGIAHAPEPRVLDRFAADGYDLVLAGHTHGGQVRVPGIGALVTNCGIDRSRARGLSRWGSHTLLNVSAGLGTSPYMPMRFCCRPEASLITLRSRVEAQERDQRSPQVDNTSAPQLQESPR